MASPEVWFDVEAIVNAAALPVPVAWPNLYFDPPEPPAPFVIVEIEGDASAPLEMGGGGWQEDGTIAFHVMVPSGTGWTEGAELRKTIADLFRGRPAAPVLYRGVRFEPGTADDDGNWYNFGLRVTYGFQDVTA